MDDDLLDTTAAARLLRRSPRTLADWRLDRRGPPWFAIEGRVLYKRGAVLEYLNARTIRPEEHRRSTLGTLLAA